MKKILASIPNFAQNCLLWAAGVETKYLAPHLRKSYVGLGFMAFASTALSTIGGFYFILLSLGSVPSAILAALLSGGFMWGLDRSVLGSSNSQSGKGTIAVKIAINLVFSTALTLPLSTYMLMSSVKQYNITNLKEDIEAIDLKLEAKDTVIQELREKKESIDGRFKERFHADGTLNKGYVREQELVQADFEYARSEKEDLIQERNLLKEEIKAFEKGDLSKTNLKFTEQFHHVFTNSRGTDQILSFTVFLITATMGSSGVLIKTFLFDDDSYNRQLQRLEEQKKNEIDFQHAMNTSAAQFHYSILNTENSPSLKSQLKAMKTRYEQKKKDYYQALLEGLDTKYLNLVRQEAEKEGINLDTFLNVKSKPNTPKRRRDQPSVFEDKPFDDLWKSSSSSEDNLSNPQPSNTPLEAKVTPNSEHQNGNGKVIATEDDILSFFKQINSQQNND